MRDALGPQARDGLALVRTTAMPQHRYNQSECLILPFFFFSVFRVSGENKRWCFDIDIHVYNYIVYVRELPGSKRFIYTLEVRSLSL